VSGTKPHNLEVLIEGYLSGNLAEADRREVERLLREDPSFRAAVEAQRQIDERLRGMFAPGEPLSRAEILSAAQDAGDAETPVKSGRFKLDRRQLVGLAAAVVVGAVAIWRLAGFFEEPEIPPYAQQPPRTFAEVYEDEVADDLEPDWVCENEQEFAEAYRKRLGRPLVLAQVPPNIVATGLAYSNSVSPYTVHLLTRVDGEPVIVFADKLRRDNPQSLPEGSHLNLFRSELDELVLYEVTPFDEPRVMEFLSVKECD